MQDVDEKLWKADLWGQCHVCNDSQDYDGNVFIMKCCNAVVCPYDSPIPPNFEGKHLASTRCRSCNTNLVSLILQNRPDLADVVEGLRQINVGINIKPRPGGVIWKPAEGQSGLDVQYELPT